MFHFQYLKNRGSILQKRAKLALLLCVTFACSLVQAAPGEQLPFKPDINKQLRVIISTDAKNEADDVFAVAHALLTPSFSVKGLVATHYARTAPMMKRDEQTMQESYKELAHLLSLMGDDKTPIWHGADKNMDIGAPHLSMSEGAQAIIDEAMRDDTRPLYVLVLGPATDIAAALLAEPKIADKLTVVWIGGMVYPAGGWEYNLFNDPVAGDLLFASKANIWQVPHNVYMSMRVSLAELAVQVKPQGKVGAYLWQQMIDFNIKASAALPGINWPKSEVWVLGDNPAVSLLLDDHEYNYTMIDAPSINEDLSYGKQSNPQQIRVYHHVDSHFTLQDFYSKLQLVYGQ